MRFVNIAARKPKMLKLISNELHSAKPIIIGSKLIFVQKPVSSPIKNCDIMIVKSGEDDFIVSTNDIDAYFSAIKPNIIEKSL